MALNINAFWGVPSPRQGWLNHLHWRSSCCWPGSASTIAAPSVA